MISIQDVTYSYPGLAGSFRLGPISLDVQEGKLVFWVGPNGSGKSTLARILCQEMVAESGSVTGLDGSFIYYHQSVEDNVFPDLTVRQHIRLLGRDQGSLKNVMRLFPELDAIGHKYPDELSGGQIQLVAFAALLARRRSFYVFDEVFNHLDAAISLRVVAALRELVIGEYKAHCVLISHDLTLTQSMADRVDVFCDGQIKSSLEGSSLRRHGFRLTDILFSSGV